MKIHRSLVQAVADALREIFEQQAFTEQVVEKLLKKDVRWGSRDRKFLANTIYSIVRNKRLVETVFETIEGSVEEKYFGWIGVFLILNGHQLPDWPEWKNFDPIKILDARDNKSFDKRVLYSMPDWLYEKGEKEFGSLQWEKEVVALNEMAEVCIRVNTQKTNIKKLQDTLLKEGIETVEFNKEFVDAFGDSGDGLQLKERKRLNSLLSFQSGLFEIQDAGSQVIAPFLNPQAKKTVIDACAGAGGKTLHIACIMQNRGRIVAMDVHDYKLKNLAERVRKAGIKIVEAKLINPNTVKECFESADYLLLDVPCSGSGVMKRQADTKWKLDSKMIDELVLLQQKLLFDYSTMLKPGGTMVYATCSIFKEENEEQVQRFLSSKNGEYQLLEQKRIFPSQGYDGFYMAKLMKVL